MHYSIQPRAWIFVKGYGFLSFAKNMSKNIGKNITKNLKVNTASKRAIQKTAEATGTLFGNKIADKITKVSRNSPQDNFETENIGFNREIPKERCISPEQ